MEDVDVMVKMLADAPEEQPRAMVRQRGAIRKVKTVGRRQKTAPRLCEADLYSPSSLAS